MVNSKQLEITGAITVVKTVTRKDMLETFEFKNVERRVVLGETRLYLRPNELPEIWIPESSLNRDILCIGGLVVHWSIKKDFQ